MRVGQDGLEIRLAFERPRFVGQDFPGGMRGDVFPRPFEEFRVVGAEKQLRAGAGTRGPQVERRRLHDAVLVVALFRPRIEEKQKELVEHDLRRERLEELFGVGLEEVEIRQPGEVALAQRALDALRDQVDADAAFLRERGGVGGEKMPVPAADFEREPVERKTADELFRERARDLLAQRVDPRGAVRHGFFVVTHCFFPLFYVLFLSFLELSKSFKLQVAG